MDRLWTLAFVAVIAINSVQGSGCPFAGANVGTDATICKQVPLKCEDSKYRSIDGSCNNLEHSWWGTPGTPYISLCNCDKDFLNNDSLPNPRAMSLKAFVDVERLDRLWAVIFMQYGQIIAHDISLTSGVAQTKRDAIVCCDKGSLTPEAATNPRCAPIPIPEDDPFNAPEGIKCMDFFRVETTNDLNCTNAPETGKPVTAVTAYLDLSFIYGSNKDTAKQVRAFKRGRLASVMRNGHEVLTQDPNPTLTCAIEDETEPCYLAGDVRVNQNPQLALLHIIYMEHHNYIAKKLAMVNPHWDDETLFQETRKIVIALHQCIIYKEYLEGALGSDFLVKNKLIYPNATGFINDYDPTVNAGPSNEYAAVAFRIFHTEIVGMIRSMKENRNTSNIIMLSDWYDRPSICEQGNNFIGLTRGMATQPTSAMDRFMPDDILNLLFKDGLLGQDLKAIDIQRSRDQGVCPYTELLRLFNLGDPKNFDDLAELNLIDPKKVELLKRLYDDVDDVEAAVALPLEKPRRSLSGAVAQAIIGDQFLRLRTGDRCFFENGVGKCALTEDQLNEIRRMCSIASILCTNKNIKQMQPEALKVISEQNPLKDCSSYPTFNPLPWKDLNV